MKSSAAEDKTMLQVKFYEQTEDARLRFAVVIAKSNGKWVLCKHHLRDTWEIPGGHREKGESIADTAARELAEETGALQAEIFPVSAYGVERENGITWGMLYLARIEEMGELPPDSEIREVGFFDRMPDELTYPAIQPHLYREIQNWLNLQSKADELWDIYDENRQLTGRLQRRGDPMQEGDYHLSVHVWMQNSRGEFLITQRSPNKGYPLMWESTGGSALTGDDSLTAALREVEEETGLRAENWKKLTHIDTTPGFCTERIALYLATGLFTSQLAACTFLRQPGPDHQHVHHCPAQASINP